MPSALVEALSDAHFILGQREAQLGRHRQTEAHFRAVLAWCSGPDTDTELRLARTLAELGALGDAKALIARCLGRDGCPLEFGLS